MTTDQRIQALEHQVRLLQNTINAFVFSSTYRFQRSLIIADGRSIQLGTDKGTMIGTTSTQKLGFFGATPVAQQSTIAAPSGGTTTDDEARTAITSITSVLDTFGFTG